MRSKIRKYFINTAIAIAAIGMLVVASDAQTSKTRKRVKRTPIVQTAPAPTTEPVIISRAEDYQLDVPVASTSVESPVRLTEADTPNSAEKIIAELTDRIKALESSKKDDYAQKQKRLAMNLDILTKAEQRVESLRKQSFEMLDKENSLRTRLEQIDSDLRPESIERSIAFVGSLRPEELRASKKKSLEAERSNVQSLLSEIQRTRSNLDLNVQKAEILVERLRTKLEGDIDSALDDNPIKP